MRFSVGLVLTAAFGLMAMSLNCAGLAALPLDQMQKVIESAQVLPRDYRNYVTLAQTGDLLSVSVYRAPDATPVDCKIDSILLTRQIIEADPSVRKVQIGFYNPSQDSRYWLTEVTASAVRAYARGAIGREDIIKAVSFENCIARSLAKSYGSLSYKEMIDHLGVVEGPLRDKRAVALVRINDLQSKGSKVDVLRSRFLHLEDLARRKQDKALASALAGLMTELDASVRPNNRIGELDAILNASAAVPVNSNAPEQLRGRPIQSEHPGVLEEPK